jgi:hypothetical protein
MTIGVIKIVGPIFTVNSTPNTVPTNAISGGNVTTNTESGGIALGPLGGATYLYIVNNGAASSNVTVGYANGSANVGTVMLLANQVMFLAKGAYETVVATPNVVATPIAYRT